MFYVEHKYLKSQILLCAKESNSGRVSVPGDDVEVVGFVGQGLFKAGPRGHHPAGVAPLRHGHLEGALGNRGAIVQDLDAVRA